MSENLKLHGFDGAKEASRLRNVQKESRETALAELRNNLTSLTHEVLKDDPVSPPYELYFGKQYPDYFKVYSDRKRTEQFAMDKQFDPGERGDVPRQAFLESTKQAKLHPGSMVLSLSLAGKAGFDNDPQNVFNKIDYNTIQFYHMFYDINQDKIFASAITASNEDLTTRMLQEFGLKPPPAGYIDPIFEDLRRTGRLNSHLSEADIQRESKVLYYLRKPVVTGMDIHQYLAHIDAQYGDELLYKNKSKTEHTVAQVAHDLNRKMSAAYEGMFHSEEIVERVMDELQSQYGDTWTKDIVDRAYFLTMKYFAMAHNVGKLELAGSCGGNTITVDQLDGLLGGLGSRASLLSSSAVLNPFTSSGRLLQQDVLESLGIMIGASCEKQGCRHTEKHFHCPEVQKGGCGKPIPAGRGHSTCPHCNLSKEAYAEMTGIKC